MMSYIMYDILKPSVFWKILRREAPIFISGGASDSLDPALFRIIVSRNLFLLQKI